MTAAETHPTRDELLAMAYVDDELAPEARAEVERRMATEPTLAREVARYQGLAVLARQVAPPEPMDHEWRRLEREPLHRTSTVAGWVLLCLGALGLGAWVVYELLIAPIGPLPKALACAVVVGVLVLFLATLRARLRTLPYDPYLEVQR